MANGYCSWDNNSMNRANKDFFQEMTDERVRKEINERLAEGEEETRKFNDQKEEEEIRLAYANPKIRNNPKALNLIKNQFSWLQMREVRLALENDKIREDEEAVNIIVSERWPERKRQMRLACEIDEIRENKEWLNIIASQDTTELMEQSRLTYEQIVLALKNDKIREDKEAESCTDIDDSIKSEKIVDSSVEDLKVKTIKLTDNN